MLGENAAEGLQAGDVAIVSALALIVDSPFIWAMCFVKKGIKPHRADTSSRSPVSLL